ncbi:MAG: hypothetical protein QOJ94_2277 [Sphingomonadales bacterium]|jgi:hypothetical protein|nr:hypothetical protein [Sphingomonadales bacterium]
MDEAGFESLLKRELAPSEAPAESAFVARVDRAVVEADLYRRARRRILTQLGSEGLAVAAVGASLAFVARVPDVREALTQAPGLLSIAGLLLLLFWLLLHPAGRAGGYRASRSAG